MVSDLKNTSKHSIIVGTIFLMSILIGTTLFFQSDKFGNKEKTNKEKIMDEITTKGKKIKSTTDNTITIDNEDGTYTMRVYQEDINTEYNYYTEDGVEYAVKQSEFFGDTDTTATNNKDTYLDAENKDTNYDSSTYIATGGNVAGVDERKRSLIHFTVPSGSGSITKVTLYAYRFFSNYIAQNIHQLSRTDWVEGEATWNIYKSGSNWTTPGGDYNGTVIDTCPLGGAAWCGFVLLGSGASNPISVDWEDELHLLLKDAETESDITKFYSKENGTNIPYLEITYTEPEPEPLVYNQIMFSEGDDDEDVWIYNQPFIYIGGNTVFRVFKYDSELNKLLQSDSQTEMIRTSAIDDDYVYFGGYDNYMVKYDKLTLTTQSTFDYTSKVRACDVDADYIYIGGNTVQEIYKLNKSDLSFVASSTGYGGTLRSLVVDDDYVYIGGYTNQKVKKFNKNDLSFVVESDDFDYDIYSLAVDDNYVYGGGSLNAFYKYDKSDLSFVASSTINPYILEFVLDNDYAYLLANVQIVKVAKSDLETILYVSDAVDNSLRDIKIYNDYVFAVGDEGIIYQYNKNDLSFIASSTDNYGGTVYAIEVL